MEEDFYGDTSAIDLSRYDQEGRPERLILVLGYVQALADVVDYGDLLAKVVQLHDHKGDLTVTWRQDPTEIEQNIFKKAWQSSIGDGGGGIEHNVIRYGELLTVG